MVPGYMPSGYPTQFFQFRGLGLKFPGKEVAMRKSFFISCSEH